MLNNKTFTKILSLVIALLLWFYVIGEVNPSTKQTIQGVEVHILNGDNLDSRDLAILGDGNFTVSLTVEGKRADLRNLDKNEIIVSADVFGYNKGENYIPVTVSAPDTIEIIDVKPAKILVNIDELVSVYKPINISFTGELDDGIEPGNITLKPEEIEVKGAKSLVESVSYVKAEVPVSQIDSTLKTVTVEAIPVNSQGEPEFNVLLSANTVDVSARLCRTKNVPMNVEIIGEVDGAYEVTHMDVPDRVILRGSKAELEDIESVTAAAVDLSKVTASGTVPLSIKLPKNVELASASEGIGINITLKGITTKTYEVDSSEIVVQGLADGENAYVNTSTLTITATGDEQLVESVEISDFILVVDVSGLEKGTNVVPVSVQYEKDFKNVTITPEEVHVTINEAS